MPIEANGNAPYTSPSAITAMIDRYRDRGLSTPFTLDVLVKAGVSESMAPRTLQALQLLGLVDDKGEPTEQFAALRQAPASELPDRFAALLRGAYAEVFSFIDPAQDNRERVRDAFRSYKPFGQQDRMVTLFIGLCEYAGLAPSTVRREPGAPQPQPRTRRQRKSKAATVAAGASAHATSGVTESTLFPGGGLREAPMPAGTHPLIQGLLRELPNIGGEWPAAKHDAWLELQAAAFKLLFKIGDEASPPQTVGGEHG